MMDAYATCRTVRLIQSYADQSGLLSTAFTYDNAASIHTYLLHGTSASLARAEVLGQGLIYAQGNNFPISDGRFAQVYFVNQASSAGAYITPAGFPFYFYTSAVGDQAWAGMAFAQLYRRTHSPAHLTAALNVASWIVTNTYNTVGPGGCSFGTNINQFNQSVPSPNGKSTEHNIDTYAFFTMLDNLTHHGVDVLYYFWFRAIVTIALLAGILFGLNSGIVHPWIDLLVCLAISWCVFQYIKGTPEFHFELTSSAGAAHSRRGLPENKRTLCVT